MLAAAVTVATRDPADLDGTVHLAHSILPSTCSDSARIHQTILCVGIIAHCTQPQREGHTPTARQQFTVTARTTDNKREFPHRPFASAVHAAALQLLHNLDFAPSRMSLLGFWAPRLRLLYARALAVFLEHADAPLDDLWVEAHVAVAPFSLAVSVQALGASAARTCRVSVCRGRRPKSLVEGRQFSDDPRGLARLVVPPVSDVLFVDPELHRMGEGLLSWLFVIRRLAGSGAPAYYVEAPAVVPSGDRVVQLVLRECERRNIEVRFVGAALGDAVAGQWAAAFIAAEVFGLLPH